jgi:hypothetical protein
MNPSQPSTFDDDIIGQQIADEAAAERQTAVLSSHQWQGITLQPFSIRRETLYFRLRALNDSLPIHLVRKHPESFLQEALIILWLCLHTPDHWNALRGNAALLMEQIEQWADENIRRADQMPAIELALQILSSADSTQAISRPTHLQGEDLGN